MIVAHVPDLMDRSKVQAAAPAGEELLFVAAPGDLAGAARTATPAARLVVVDLGRPGVLEVLPGVVAAVGPGAEVIGFGSHVDREVLDAARAAGCSGVLARSEFFRRLAEVLAGPAT